MRKTNGKKKYSTRDPRALSPKLAQAVGEAIEALATKHGRATPELLVREARAKGHPLHKLIWAKSDEDAAWQYRVQAARIIMGAVRIEVHGSTVPAFINVNVGDGYVSAKTVFEDVDATAKLLADTLRDLEAWYRRAIRIRDAAGAEKLEPVFAAVEKIVSKPDRRAA
jgi:hypothetical protein